jgi:hypothetical protein
MRPAEPNTTPSLLFKAHRTVKPEEILSLGGTTNYARLKGQLFSLTQFENLPGEPISDEELAQSLTDSREAE